MKILLIFTLCLISDGGTSEDVTGYIGGGVLIKCKYDAKYTNNIKIFCKGSWLQAGCVGQIKTGDKDVWVHSGRFSLFDDTRSAEFSVMIRDLTVQDSGTYHFAAGDWKIICTPVDLNINKGDSREVIAYAGTRSNIKCRYEDKYKEEKKSFCKMGTDQWCVKQISTDQSSEWAHKGKFSIHDNRSAGFFSVFIRELSTEDTGTYACTIVLLDKTEIYTLMNMSVTEDLSDEMSITDTVHVGGDLTVSCKYPESHKNDYKFLCQKKTTAACSYSSTVKENRKLLNDGKYSLHDDRERQMFTVSIRNMATQDSGEYWCGAEVDWKSESGYKVYFRQIDLTVTGFPVSTVITVSVILLLLLLIGITMLILNLPNRCKKQEGPEKVKQTFRRTNGDQEKDPDVFPLQSRENTRLPQ